MSSWSQQTTISRGVSQRGSFARKYELPSFEQLARIEIESLSQKVPFSVFLGFMQKSRIFG